MRYRSTVAAIVAAIGIILALIPTPHVKQPQNYIHATAGGRQ